ncbi:uncharacterized protein NFIA_060410 [Aspergillus fischeri NRRL 181]|uniref:Uncharacterized protein n=1 Tax=Neosartorya fischeri (strain ATCC 1020 / DSM 3700 / CBS 544.65 / FGSC A1164 / JCM 1740 / NRRL 181 / WB 181) TaxID=331117 RepID=A1DPG4_NEOFI|nr:uncharacterized protein NFIA_060410 [Aspergillus fischeri NRRL 181]EAW16685.1 hypothetical protein NFIA_060410 [Aspergillus fischeri NRRL 181]
MITLANIRKGVLLHKLILLEAMGPLSFSPIQHTAGESPGELLNLKEVSANL